MQYEECRGGAYMDKVSENAPARQTYRRIAGKIGGGGKQKISISASKTIKKRCFCSIVCLLAGSNS
jgi:hypothetical protein